MPACLQALETLLRELMHLNPGAARSLQEGREDTLTVHRLRLPDKLRRTLSSTNLIESTFSTVEMVCRNVKRWRDASMALRWTAAAMQEATKGFRRLKAHKQLPILRAALAAHHAKHSQEPLGPTAVAA